MKYFQITFSKIQNNEPILLGEALIKAQSIKDICGTLSDETKSFPEDVKHIVISEVRKSEFIDRFNLVKSKIDFTKDGNYIDESRLE